jgi:hypothetical protein
VKWAYRPRRNGSLYSSLKYVISTAHWVKITMNYLWMMNVNHNYEICSRRAVYRGYLCHWMNRGLVANSSFDEFPETATANTRYSRDGYKRKKEKGKNNHHFSFFQKQPANTLVEVRTNLKCCLLQKNGMNRVYANVFGGWFFFGLDQSKKQKKIKKTRVCAKVIAQ